MLVLEQRLSARHLGRGVVLSARLVHGVEAQGWRMKFSLLKAEVEIEADPATYRELARRLNAANVHCGPEVSCKPNCGQQATILASNNQMKTSYCQETNDVKVNSPPCHSPGAILPDLPQPAEDPDKNSGLSKEASSSETQAWLARNRFSHYAATFNNFSGADLLRLTRDEIIQICGFPDGIRLFNALHATRILPRLTVYVCPAGSNIYSALYLHNCRAHELLQKLNSLVHASKECETVLVSGPNGARVRLTDDLVRHMPDNSFYRLERVDDCGALLLCATNNN
ncbi:hypothetical protein SFRURICE_015734 [Spodoptera frugiperda]|nr:hypothetical protein SFRURICE_015734 [Spodoptera frugiperda]